MGRMKNQYFQYFLIFFITATSFFLFRSTEGLVWNDSPHTAENLYDFYQGDAGTKPICREDGASGLRLDNTNFWKTITTRAFSCLEFGGYRPVSALLSFVGVSVFSDAYDPTKNSAYLGTIWMIGVSFLFGFLAILLFSISKRFVQSNYAAYLILLLFFFSPSMVSGAWILFSGGIQITVPLFICLGLWIYFRTIESVGRKVFWIVLLALFLLIGPLVREFIGVVALLIIFNELQIYRRPTPLMVLGILGTLHAIYPTAIMHFLVPKLPILPVFKLGSLSTQLNTSFNLRWDVLGVFALQLPPTFSIISGIILLISIKKYLKILQLRKLSFLVVWFCVSFFPFLKVYSEHVHLAYPLIPFLILLISGTESFWCVNARFVRDKAMGPNNDKRKYTLLKVGAAAVLLLAIIDQSLNAYASIVTVKSMNRGVRYMADWFRLNTPNGSLVIANALHAEDIRFYSRNHIVPYWSVGIGVPPERTLENPDELKDFLKTNFGSKTILLLNIDQEFTAGKGIYHAHKYLTRKTVNVAHLGKIYYSEAHFPYLDPLKIFLPRSMILFLGPPDLENDIYFGHDREKRPFINEFNVEYSVYKVLSPFVSSAAYFRSDNTFLYPQYLKMLKEYKLYGYLDKYYALKNDTPFELNNLGSALVGLTIEEIERQIEH